MEEPKNRDVHGNEMPGNMTWESQVVEFMMSVMNIQDPVEAGYRHYLEERFILRDLHVSKKDRVLDLGCGIGRVSFILARLAAHVDGVDHSRRYIEIANELKAIHQTPNASFTCASAFDFSPDPGGYDLIYMGGLLLSLRQDEEVLALIRRLRPFIRVNGKIAIREASPIGGMRILRDRVVFRTMDELVGIFGKAGLHLEKLRVGRPIGPVFYRVAAVMFPNLRKPEYAFSRNALRIFRIQEHFHWLLKPIARCRRILVGQPSPRSPYFHIYRAQ